MPVLCFLDANVFGTPEWIAPEVGLRALYSLPESLQCTQCSSVCVNSRSKRTFFVFAAIYVLLSFTMRRCHFLQMYSSGVQSKAADVYSFGVVLWELATQERYEPVYIYDTCCSQWP